MPALFPDDKETITMKQGKVGDCYLLASLDCIFAVGSEGRDAVKSLFTENDDGSITVRIKRTKLSDHLQKAKLTGQFSYEQDTRRNEDVFTVSKEKFGEIEGFKDGVQTNCLAVKILEHITPYYYLNDWDHSKPFGNISAHMLNHRFSSSTTAFIGALLGIETFEEEELDVLLKLKTISPEQPLYLSMRWGNADKLGNIHDRHSFRLKQIIPKEGRDPDFILVNPQDNQSEMTISFADLKSRKPRFCLFGANKAKHELTCALLKCNEQQGAFVFANPGLLNKLMSMQKTGTELSPKNITASISLYKAAESAIRTCIQNINDFSISFDETNTVSEVHGKKASLVEKLNGLLPDLSAAHATLGIVDIHPDICLALSVKEKQIEAGAVARLSKVKSENESFCKIMGINFKYYFLIIECHKMILESKAESDDAFKKEAATAKLLHEELLSAKRTFLDSNKSKDVKISGLILSCFEVVKQAMPVLEKQAELQEILSDFRKALMTVVSATATRQTGFFACSVAAAQASMIRPILADTMVHC